MNEKLTPSQKAGIQKALGSKHSSNSLRKTSTPARALIDLVKKHGKNDMKEKVEQVDEKMSDLQKKTVRSIQNLRFKLHKDGHLDTKPSISDTKRTIRFVKNEEVEQFDEILKASDSVGKWIDDFTHSKDPKFNGKSKEERRKMALGAYYGAQKESYENSTEELAEGRGRPPKEGSKAWHAAKAKSSSGESSDQEADKNIVNQMRKKPFGDTHHLVFGNGDKKDVHVRHVNKALSMLANTPKPKDREKLQNSLGHSHKRFMDTVTSGKAVEDAPRERVTLAKRVAEAIDRKTASSDKKPMVAVTKIGPNGKLSVFNRSQGPTTRDVADAQESYDLSDEVTNSLNNLYNSLSEQNKELFEERIMTEEGVFDLINFARKQGF